MRLLSPTQLGLLRLGVISRLLILALTLATQLTRLQLTSTDSSSFSSSILSSHYDASTQLLLENAKIQRAECADVGVVQRVVLESLSWQMHWDGMHFIESTRPTFDASSSQSNNISNTNSACDFGYSVEKETAFFPGLPLIVRAGAEVIQFLTFNSCSCTYTAILLSSFLLSTLCFFLNILLLHYLTILVTNGSSHLSYITTLCFIFTPSSIFMSSFYSEGIFSTFAFSGMIVREKGYKWMSALMFAECTCIRGNGWIFAGFVVFDAIQYTIRAWRSKKRVSIVANVLVWIQALACVGITILPFILYQLHLARRFCSSELMLSSSPPPYCASFFPNIYSYVQKKYWNVGFLSYYTLQQLPNFLFALPVWFLSFRGITEYARADLTRFLTLEMDSSSGRKKSSADATNTTVPSSSPSSSTSSSFLSSSRLLVYIYLWSALLFICVTILHVQVSTRFLSSCPPVYWYAAHLILQQQQRLASPSSSSSSSSPSTTSSVNFGSVNITRVLTVWSALFMVIGSVLFSAFLPWT